MLLQFWRKLNTRGILKTCPFCFLRDYYGDSLDVMFPQFLNHFLPFPLVFPPVSTSVSTISSVVSTVSPFCCWYNCLFPGDRFLRMIDTQETY